MSRSDVIKSFDSIGFNKLSNPAYELSLILFTVVVCILLCSCILELFIKKKKLEIREFSYTIDEKIELKEKVSDLNKQVAVGVGILILIIILCLGLCKLILETSNKAYENVENWKTEIAYPYIENNMEIKTIELISVSTTGSISDEKGKEYLKLVVKNEDGNIKTIKGKYKFYMDLETGSKPYLKYYDLENDINDRILKGMYFGEVHVSEDYDLR